MYECSVINTLALKPSKESNCEIREDLDNIPALLTTGKESIVQV